MSTHHFAVLQCSFRANPPTVSRANRRLSLQLAFRSMATTTVARESMAQLKRVSSSFGFHAKPHPKRFLLVEACEIEKEISVEEDPVKLRTRDKSKPDLLQNSSSIGVALLGLGFFIGPLLDGIHSNVQLQIYDNGAIEIGSIHTNVVVPPLLAIFYSVVGLLQLSLDKWLAPKDRLPNTSLQRLVLSLICLIIILELSAEMYKAGVPYNIESYVLFALAELNWVLFDGTWWGFALAVIVGVGCPLSEIPLMKFFNLWHYPKANVEVLGEGLVTWVLTCYFSYTPFVANLSRWLSLQFNSQKSEQISD